MGSFGYALRKKWNKKRDDIRQERYTRQHDILFRKNTTEKIIFGIVFVILVLFAVSFIFPFLWIFINAFKEPAEYSASMMGWPTHFTMENFIEALTFNEDSSEMTILQMLGMTVIIAGVGTVVTVFTSSTAAYVVAKYKFFGRGIIFSVVIFSLIVPIVGSLPSQIQIMREVLHLDGTIIGCIFIYSGGFGANFLLLYSFFTNLSWTYIEAARIDGANDFRIFFRIVLPMARGPIIAITIIQLIGLWNDYQTPSIYLPDYPTLAVGLRDIFNQMSFYPMPVIFAIIIVAMLPIILIFTIFSKIIMENTSVGGLKG